MFVAVSRTIYENHWLIVCRDDFKTSFILFENTINYRKIQRNSCPRKADMANLGH